MHCDFDQMLQPEMHDSENGAHSANGAETLVLTANNLVYPEPSSTYYDVININHHHHHLHQNHHNYHHQYHHTPHNHNDNHHHQDHLIEHHHSNVIEPHYHDITTSVAATTQPAATPTTHAQTPNATQISDPQNQTCTDLVDQSNTNDLSLFHNQNLNLTEPIVIDNNNDTPYLTSTLQQQPKNEQVEQDVDDDDDEEDEEEGEDEDDEDDENDDDDEDDDDEDDEDDGDEDDEDDDDDEVDDEDEADESEDDSEAIVDPGQHCQQAHLNTNRLDTIGDDLMIKNNDLKNGADVLDGERMLEVTRKLVRNTERDPDRDLRKQVLLKTAIKKLPHFMDYSRYSDSLDRSFHTNISPQAYYEHHDSQPKFYNSVQPNAIQMSTTGLRMLDLNDDHDPDLVNIDQTHSDPNLAYHNNNNNNSNNNNINSINRTASLEHHDYLSHQHQQNQYDRYHQRTHELSHHYEPNNGPQLLRHNSLDNLYQPIINGSSDMNEDVKDVGNGEERIPLAFQIACEIYDFTCTSEDNEKKLLDNLTDGYFTTTTTTKSTIQESRTTNSPDEVDDCDADSRDPDGSETSSSSSHSSISTSDDSANSLVSQSNESDEANGSSLLETSLNSSSDFYHSSHDSGVALFPTSKKSNNKRSSSSIGLDDEMDIDHLTELSSRSSTFNPNNQYKKLRKREIIE